jgi:mannonate dehydratase
LKLAEALGTHENQLWTLCKQMDVNYAVTGLPREENGYKPWDYVNLLHMKQRFENFGFKVEVIESQKQGLH